MPAKTEWEANLKNIPFPLLKTMLQAIRSELKKRQYAVIGQNLREERAKSLGSIPFTGKVPNVKPFSKQWYAYLVRLLNQDWSYLFKGGDQEKKYYVYFHVMPGTRFEFHSLDCPSIKCNGTPFYVGKGCGERAWDLKRNQGHGALLSELKAVGKKSRDIVYVVRTGLTESEAFELESKFIYFFGTRYETDRNGILVNLDIPATPEICEHSDQSMLNANLDHRRCS